MAKNTGHNGHNLWSLVGRPGKQPLPSLLDPISSAPDYNHSRQDSFVEQPGFPADFVLFPLAVWMGRKHYQTDSPVVITSKIRELFGSVPKNDETIRGFLSAEASKLVRYSSHGKAAGYHTLPELLAILEYGCNELEKYARSKEGLSLEGLRLQLRKEFGAFGKEIFFSKLARYLLNGKPDRHWYRDTYNELTTLLPMIEPKTLFGFMAGTSMNAKLESNVHFFFKAVAQYHRGKMHVYRNVSFPGGEIETRFSGLLPGIVYQLEWFLEHGKLKGRKIMNFSEAMLGDIEAIVVDIWIMRAFGADRRYLVEGGYLKSRSPEKKLYDVIEYATRRMAKIVDLEPREFCSMLWGGVRTEETGRGNKTMYTPFMSQHLFLRDLYLSPKDIHFGANGIHLGSEATRNYVQHLLDNRPELKIKERPLDAVT